MIATYELRDDTTFKPYTLTIKIENEEDHDFVRQAFMDAPYRDSNSYGGQCRDLILEAIESYEADYL